MGGARRQDKTTAEIASEEIEKLATRSVRASTVSGEPSVEQVGSATSAAQIPKEDLHRPTCKIHRDELLGLLGSDASNAELDEDVESAKPDDAAAAGSVTPDDVANAPVASTGDSMNNTNNTNTTNTTSDGAGEIGRGTERSDEVAATSDSAPDPARGDNIGREAGGSPEAAGAADPGPATAAEPADPAIGAEARDATKPDDEYTTGGAATDDAPAGAKVDALAATDDTGRAASDPTKPDDQYTGGAATDDAPAGAKLDALAATDDTGRAASDPTKPDDQYTGGAATDDAPAGAKLDALAATDDTGREAPERTPTDDASAGAMPDAIAATDDTGREASDAKPDTAAVDASEQLDEISRLVGVATEDEVVDLQERDRKTEVMVANDFKMMLRHGVAEAVAPIAPIAESDPRATTVSYAEADERDVASRRRSSPETLPDPTPPAAFPRPAAHTLEVTPEMLHEAARVPRPAAFTLEVTPEMLEEANAPRPASALEASPGMAVDMIGRQELAAELMAAALARTPRTAPPQTMPLTPEMMQDAMRTGRASSDTAPLEPERVAEITLEDRLSRLEAMAKPVEDEVIELAPRRRRFERDDTEHVVPATHDLGLMIGAGLFILALVAVIATLALL